MPDDPVNYCYIPSVKDPSFAPPGYHSCTLFSHYFPPHGSRAKHDAHKQLMADRVTGLPGYNSAREVLTTWAG